jgi:hypothetical protein
VFDAQVPKANDRRPVTGYMVAFRGKKRGDIDLFQASPFNITGVYIFEKQGQLETHSFEINVMSSPNVLPQYDVTVETYNGFLSLPNARSLTRDRPNYKTFSGNIVQVNKALSLIQYRVPGPAKPFFNTLSYPNSLYGTTHESIVITVDDRRNSGAASPYASNMAPLKYGGSRLDSKAIFDFVVLVVSDNNRPTLTALPSYTVLEDALLKPSDVNLVDVDAADVISGQTGPINGAEMKLTLSCKHGAVRIPSALAKDVLVTWPLARTCFKPCADDYTRYTQQGPTVAEFRALSKGCVECQSVDGAAFAAEFGAGRMEVFGKLSVQTWLLQNMSYQGKIGYNSNNPERALPYAPNGCKLTLPPGESPTSTEAITVVAEDLSNAGCTNKASLKHELQLPIVVTPVNSDPKLYLIRDGNDVCNLCNLYGECFDECPKKYTPTITLFEGDPVPFNSSFALQVSEMSLRACDSGEQALLEWNP